MFYVNFIYLSGDSLPGSCHGEQKPLEDPFDPQLNLEQTLHQDPADPQPGPSIPIALCSFDVTVFRPKPYTWKYYHWFSEIDLATCSKYIAIIFRFIFILFFTHGLSFKCIYTLGGSFLDRD